MFGDRHKATFIDMVMVSIRCRVRLYIRLELAKGFSVTVKVRFSGTVICE